MNSLKIEQKMVYIVVGIMAIKKDRETTTIDILVKKIERKL